MVCALPRVAGGRCRQPCCSPGRAALPGPARVINILLSQGALEFRHHRTLDVLDSWLPSSSSFPPSFPGLYLPQAVGKAAGADGKGSGFGRKRCRGNKTLGENRFRSSLCHSAAHPEKRHPSESPRKGDKNSNYTALSRLLMPRADA